jgi:hypothetical protein
MPVDGPSLPFTDLRITTAIRGRADLSLSFALPVRPRPGPPGGSWAVQVEDMLGATCTSSPLSLGNYGHSCRRLPAGDVLFEKIGMLQADELDRKAIFEVADDPADSLADGDGGSDVGSVLGRDRGARF